MNRPDTVIKYVNAAHFIDHYAMLVFPAALIVMGPELGYSYGKLLPYGTPGFIAFGAGSLVTGWLGDVWSRRHMMLVFFIGIGLAMIATGFAQTPLQIGLGVFVIGAFAAIYHPVGTAMIVAYAPKLGREIGINGVFGNIGVASSALATGALSQFFGWRAAFMVPGAIAIVAGILFALNVAHEDRKAAKAGATPVRIARGDMWKVILALVLTVIASSTSFNTVTVALPKLFAERLADLTVSPAVLGVIMAGVYLFGAASQYTIGSLIDRHGLKAVFLPLCFLSMPALYLAAIASGPALLPVSVVLIIAIFGQVTINDAMVGKYTTDKWRSTAYSLRYFIGFTAAGTSVALIAAMHESGGFALTFKVLAILSILVIAGGLIFPSEKTEAAAAE
ncbi:MAG: MFS transporter [Rhodospirillaceae bacterium]|nr:MFS transporter [Rhodospirillaceae bacterium]